MGYLHYIRTTWTHERLVTQTLREGREVLVLARKVGQSIMVDESIEITVIEVRGEQVRLGIIAPRSVVVKRKELLERTKSVQDVSTDESETTDTSSET